MRIDSAYDRLGTQKYRVQIDANRTQRQNSTISTLVIVSIREHHWSSKCASRDKQSKNSFLDPPTWPKRTSRSAKVFRAHLTLKDQPEQVEKFSQDNTKSLSPEMQRSAPRMWPSHQTPQAEPPVRYDPRSCLAVIQTDLHYCIWKQYIFS